MPVQIGRRIDAQVYSDIEHRATQATHNLDFSMWWMLEMQTTHNPLVMRECVVDLRNGLGLTCRTEFFGAVKAGKKSSHILDRFALH